MTDSTRPACARLAQALQGLRARTGLSMAVLAERTAYSKSSWQRYLNGDQLAPRKAVDALCAMAGESPGRLLALWELADQEWSGRAQAVAPAVPLEGDKRLDTRGIPADRATTGQAREWTWNLGWRRWVFAAAVVLGLAAAVWITALPGTSAKDPTQRSAHPAAPPDLGCQGQTCVGRDPLMTGCAAPGQVKDIGLKEPYRTSTDALLGFRYSKRCHAAWAMLWRADLGDVLEFSGPGGSSQRVQVREMDEGSVTTPMLDGAELDRLQACYEPAGGHLKCFRLV
ncbi:helix-turn-helix domain-containing protein [Streptomyces sp. NBC_01455]|uniref:helix-turn-helix domain-containing protein n=1 Tax=Streptomyces sp. NBC_01455 TaxID=2903874 RepID=UPI002E378EEB|nr:DUF2690 domain-containing protein [Streptomyces sp. NBC_01455]